MLREIHHFSVFGGGSGKGIERIVAAVKFFLTDVK